MQADGGAFIPHEPGTNEAKNSQWLRRQGAHLPMTTIVQKYRTANCLFQQFLPQVFGVARASKIHSSFLPKKSHSYDEF